MFSLCLYLCLYLSVCVTLCIGDRSRREYNNHLTINSDVLLVRVIDSFDHELDTSVTVTYRCHVMTSNMTHTSSCHARVVINDVNDEGPYIKFSNLTTAKYDRLAPIEITGQVAS